MKFAVFIYTSFLLLLFARSSEVDEVKNILQTQLDSVKSMIRNFAEVRDSDALKNETQILINRTTEEFSRLSAIIQRSLDATMGSINAKVNTISDYSVKRTNALINHLLSDITSQQLFNIDYSECLITKPNLQSIFDSFKLRIKLTLETSLRTANTTVRQNTAKMNQLKILLNSYSLRLQDCAASDADCILKISDEVVNSNDIFLESFDSILDNVQNLPQVIISGATKDAQKTVYGEEDYACDNANLILTCIQTYNADQTTTVSYLKTSIVTTISSTTLIPTTSGTTINPSTYCSHSPFNPLVN